MMVPSLAFLLRRRRPPTGEPDEVALVHGWLARCTATAGEAERLTVEVLRRRGEPTPACLATAPPGTRLRYLAVESVLRTRGVL